MENPQSYTAPLVVLPTGRLGTKTTSLDYPGYLFYSDGRVFNTRKKRWLKTQSINTNAYPKVRLLGTDGISRTYSLHVVIAHVFLGPLPIGFHFVDHKDGNRQNAAITNLRYVSRAHNNYNRASHKNSSSQYVGVVKRAKGWDANIKAEGQANKYLGRFATEQEAAAAYQVAKARLHVIPTFLRFPVL